MQVEQISYTNLGTLYIRLWNAIQKKSIYIILLPSINVSNISNLPHILAVNRSDLMYELHVFYLYILDYAIIREYGTYKCLLIKIEP